MNCVGEACWWTVHPASKQRSEGEKVRVGDDVIFVSVATERYLVRQANVFRQTQNEKKNFEPDTFTGKISPRNVSLYQKGGGGVGEK